MAVPEIVTIDCDYIHPRFAAAYLRITGDEAAFIETNTALAAPRLLATLAERGLRPEQVRWVIVTHCHLDHAGGAGAIMRACPNATLLAHPRAARHIIDPAKLVASATKVYGEERFRALYGSIEPVPAERVKSLDDGAEVEIAGETLKFVHVKGHANHHFAVHDPAAEAVYTGDAFGLVYPALQRPGPFALPSTSPTDFDVDEARKSIDRIIALEPSRLFLTHYGEVRDVGPVAAQLFEWLERSEKAQDEAAASDLTGHALEQLVEGRLRAGLEIQAQWAGLALTDADRELLRLDLELNAQGIAWAATKEREGKAKPA